MKIVKKIQPKIVIFTSQEKLLCFCNEVADRMANMEIPDQTASLG